MRILLLCTVAATSLLAQSPVVQVANTSRPGSTDFQVGDRFEIAITAAADQAISVRTTRDGRSDWGPVIARTDATGRWSITGQYRESDFGNWDEFWTVGGRVATPVMHFMVAGPCLKGGYALFEAMGLPMKETCETSEGMRTFQTRNDGEPFNTPDGRTISPRPMLGMGEWEQQRELMQSLITERSRPWGSPVSGDNAAALITEIIGVNALTDNETQNVLVIVRAAYKKRHHLGKAAKPVATEQLLQNLANATEQDSLKQQIVELIAQVEAPGR